MADIESVHAAGLTDWTVTPSSLRTRFASGDFGAGARLIAEFARAADAADHHPEARLTYGHVDVRLSSHDAGDVTDRDLALARTFSDIAAGLGIRAEPAAITVVELGLDTPDADEIAPFWAAVLRLPRDRRTGEITDPGGAATTLWFQQTDPHPAPRQRFHLDVWVAPEAARARVEAALAAGGTLVSDDRAPSFWVLADAQGNHACICTAQDR